MGGLTMESTQKAIIQNTLIQNIDLKKNDLLIIKQALIDYWYSFEDSLMQNDIGNVERKINKLLEAF